MSDTMSVPVSSPAPAANETPINEAPVAAPQPLGTQSPERAPDTPRPSATEKTAQRREAIQRAFDRANQPDDKPARQRPGMGHNQPPEPMAKERQAQPPQPPQQPRPRAEHGHFASAQPPQPQDGAQPARVPSRYQPLHETAPYREPPRRFDPQAAADWHGAPESVRAATHRIVQEMGVGIQRYREHAEQFGQIADFAEMARGHNTTLRQALTNYVTMEQKLRTDLIGGLDTIVRNLGLSHEGRDITLRDVAYHILNMSPDQHRMTQTQNATQANQMQMGQVMQEMRALADSVKQMQYGAYYDRTLSVVDQFADQHPRFEELADVIKSEINLGFSLDEAYARADRLYPSAGGNGRTQAAQTRTATAQTRQVDKSIHGAPDSSLSLNGRARKGPPPTRREAIENAVRRMNGSL